MKTLLKFLAFIICISIIIISCDTVESPSPEAFDIVTSEDTARVPLEITYSVYKVDDVKVDYIQYKDAEGLQTVNNPTLPWSLTLNVPRNMNFYLRAKGTITQGKVTVKMVGYGEEGGHSQTVVDSTSKSKY